MCDLTSTRVVLILSQDYCVETENSQHASNNRSVKVTVVESLLLGEKEGQWAGGGKLKILSVCRPIRQPFAFVLTLDAVESGGIHCFCLEQFFGQADDGATQQTPRREQKGTKETLACFDDHSIADVRVRTSQPVWTPAFAVLANKAESVLSTRLVCAMVWETMVW